MRSKVALPLSRIPQVMQHRKDLNAGGQHALEHAVREPPDCHTSDVLQHHAVEFGMSGDLIYDPFDFRNQPRDQACLPGLKVIAPSQ